MAIIKKLFIKNDQLKYIGHSKDWLIAADLSKRYYFDESDMALDHRLKEFVYC